MGVWPWVIVQPQRGLVMRSWLPVSVQPQQQMQVLFPVTPRAGEFHAAEAMISTRLSQHLSTEHQDGS